MASAQGLLVIERILRDRDGIWRQIAEERDLQSLSGSMLCSSAIALAGYGAVLGASNGWAQALSSAVKLPILFLLTLVICLPTLYLFNLVFGARLSLRQAVALVSVAVTVLSMLAVAFAPISLFFLITTMHYSFYKVLNVAILTLTACVGLRFLITGMRSLNLHKNRLDQMARMEQGDGPAPQPAVETPAEAPVEAPAAPLVAASVATPGVPAVTAPVRAGVPHVVAPPNGATPAGQPALVPGMQPAPPQRAPEAKPASMGLLYIWIVVFGFVGTQLAYTLRPFFGDPDKPFAIFRELNGNFYVDIVRSIGHMF